MRIILKIWRDIAYSYIASKWWNLWEKASLVFYRSEQDTLTREERYMVLDSIEETLRALERNRFSLERHQRVLGKYERDNRVNTYIETMKSFSEAAEQILDQAKKNLDKQRDFLNNLELYKFRPNPVYNKWYATVMRFRFKKRQHLVRIRLKKGSITVRAIQAEVAQT